MTAGTVSRTPVRPRRSWRGVLGALTGLSALVAVPLLMAALRDPQVVERAMVGLYDLFGMDGAATALREQGMTRLSSKALTAAVAITVGVGGVWVYFVAGNSVLERLVPSRARRQLRPWLFVGPAVVMVGVFLVFPVISTIWTSATEDGGLVANYVFALTDRSMLIAFRNNVLWLVLATGGSVMIGLVFAGLVDRVKREALAKTFIFLPLAISFVGASVIWRFVYAWRPAGEPQIGVLNAALGTIGIDPVPWIQTPWLNTFALIAIMIWLQTGFAMVILSAAIKGVPREVIEAARVDGANERQIFLRIVLPSIRGTILTVATTILIAVLKVFDIVYVMTGGRFESDVVANRMFAEMFRFRNFGQASALATILFLAVVPVMVVNIRRLRRQGFRA